MAKLATSRITAIFLPLVNFQLFLTLITFPFLVAWGLPFTPMSIIGTLVFSPCLSAALCMLSGIVCLEILGIPNTPLIFFFEKGTHMWLKILATAPSFFYAFPIPLSPWFLCVIPIATLGILHLLCFKKPISCLFAFLSLLSICTLGLHLLPSKAQHANVPYGKKCISITQEKNGLTIHHNAPHALRRTSIEKWIEYTLLPCLASNFGAYAVDTLSITKLTSATYQFTELLCKKHMIRSTIIIDAPSTTKWQTKIYNLAQRHKLLIKLKQ